MNRRWSYFLLVLALTGVGALDLVTDTAPWLYVIPVICVALCGWLGWESV